MHGHAKAIQLAVPFTALIRPDDSTQPHAHTAPVLRAMPIMAASQQLTHSAHSRAISRNLN